VTMAHALGALSELQAVAAGRMRAAAGAVVVVDDSTAAVLRADGKLLGSILHAGALRVAALEDVPGELPETEAGAVEYVVVVCDLSERVLKACEALQAGGGRVRSVLLTAPSCAKRCAEGELRLSGGSVAVSWLPLFFAPFVCLPQPTVMLSGAQLTAQHVSGRAAAPDELGALAYQACVMMEGLSGSKYQVFAVGSRPRALAMAMKDWTNPVREAVAGGQWRDESQIEPAHLLILDGDADLVSAGRHGDDNAGALLDFIFWNDIFVSGGPPQAAPGISSMCQPEAWGSGDTTKRPLRPRGAGSCCVPTTAGRGSCCVACASAGGQMGAGWSSRVCATPSRAARTPRPMTPTSRCTYAFLSRALSIFPLYGMREYGDGRAGAVG